MRLALQPRTEQTVRLLVALADGGRWRANDLAERAGVTPAVTAHLVQPLTRAGWVRSVPGPRGGHELSCDLRQLSLFDLIEAVEGPTHDDVCVMADRPCPSPGCVIHDAWMNARERLVGLLRDLTLHDVIATKRTAPSDPHKETP